MTSVTDAANALSIIIENMTDNSVSDEMLGGLVRRHSGELQRAIMLVYMLRTPITFGDDLRHSDYGRLVAVIQDARAFAILTRSDPSAIKEAGGYPIASVWIADAVINFARAMRDGGGSEAISCLAEIIAENASEGGVK